MHNFIAIKRGLILLIVLAASSYSLYAQDTVQYATDTTTVAEKQRAVKGEKVNGQVTDGETNGPLAGISITVPGYSATITDEKGNFSISVPNSKASIEVSKAGYHTKLVQAIKGLTLAIRIYPTSFPSLFATINTPFGTQSLSRSTSAIASQSNQGNWSANSETPGSYYQGRLAGVNAVRRSGTDAIGADFFVRGFSSLYATNSPLYVIDGMIYDNNSYGVSLAGGHLNNPLQHLDIRDIESVTVIKDAAGSAVYGTRAANGVVLINTHRATELATKIDFSAYGGINLSPKNLPVMGNNDYRAYVSDILKDVVKSFGLSGSAIAALPYMNDDRATNPQYGTYFNNTNWQDKVFRTSHDQNYYLKVTGGDNIAKYALSLGYTNGKGITDSTDYLRYNTRFNADLNLASKLTANTNLSFSYAEQALKAQGISPQTNPIFAALVKAPFLNPNAVSETGAISPTLADVDIFGTSNPRSLIEKALNGKKAYRFAGSSNFVYTFNKSFNASTLIGINYDKAQENLFVPRVGIANDTLFNVVADSRLGAQTTRYFNVFNDTRLNYSKTINSIHKVNAVAGFRFSESKSEQDFGLGYNSGTDQLVTAGNSASNSRLLGGNIGTWRNLNTYLSADYSFADKYIVNATVAVDGSSRFGNQISNALTLGGVKMAVLPAFSAAWIVSSEGFMKGMKKLDLLKLRVSYGLVGNDDVGNYTARQYYVSQNLLGFQGLVRGNIANPYLQWEVVKKLNVGIDASVLNERLSFSVNYFNNETDKMLTEQPAGGITGISSYVSNNAGMRTTGFDVGMNARIFNSAFKWDIGLTLGKSKNEVTTLATDVLYNEFGGATYITRVGQSANLFYGYRTAGVYATAAEAASAGISLRKPSGELIPFKAGDVRFVDGNNGDKAIDANDRVVIGDPNPDFFGSFSNSFHYKAWSLDALFTFVSGNDVFNYTRSQLESGMNFYNQTIAMNNRWRGEGQVTNIPKASFGDPMGNSRFSDRWIEDGSYLRLRTLVLSYNIPLKLTALKSLNVYATANNVFTLSKYLGYDPEFSASGSIFNQGVDNTLEPQFKSFQLGLRLGL